MQFTRAEEYGIMGVIYLAEQERDRVVPLSEIAQSQDVPEKFLAKIFQNLTKAGVVRSHRGVKGGFTFAKNPDEVTIREIVEIIQGPYHLIRCLHEVDCCEKYKECPIRLVLEEAEEKLLEIFNKYNIGQMICWRKTHAPS
ncbi:putative HTH-type transcriptional regulator aq_268 [Candidatus Zixiibacteriota bacterium]|nr:putative HTH-type transcriptional regulator aq_268 [candidate division Zixibacteria bacterium]